MQVLQNIEYQYDSIGESRPGHMLRKEKRINNITTYSTFILYFFVGILGHITSLINLKKEIQEDTFEGTNKTCYNFLPYMFYIPLPTDTKEQCKTVLFLMDIGFATSAAIISAHDGIFTGLLNCLKTQMLIICDVFQTIRVRALKTTNLPENYAIFQDMHNPVLEKEIYRLLIHTTEHLKILLGVRNELEYIFSFVILIQAFASLFTVASCLYVASTVSIGSPEFVAQLEYFFCIFLQLSLVCWFGNEITRAVSHLKI
ncbi:hypothetical protein JTB14_003381 [Gonioctena quinquepunctata]|nr:hypothetical protein JTB14_003381 [Gonioctena quinquepunctata]